MTRILKGLTKLARLDRPIGIWLIFWPALATLLATTQGQDFAKNLFIIIIGSIVVRSLGCVINDIFDRNIDSKVARTKNRPIAAGHISVFEALTFFVFLSLIAILLLIHTNFHTLFDFIFQYTSYCTLTCWDMFGTCLGYGWNMFGICFGHI